MVAANLPDLVIYLGPGVGLAVVGFVGYWLRHRNVVRKSEQNERIK